MAGLYLHIPFCASRCIYCGFYSTTLLDERQQYVDAMCREMEMRGILGGNAAEYINTGTKLNDTGAGHIDTIYLGGGTPSQLTIAQLEQLFIYINKVYGLHIGSQPTLPSATGGRKDEKAGRRLPSGNGGRIADGGLEVTMEMNPDDVTDDYALAVRRLGINRVSLGAQTFDDRRLRFLRRRHCAAQVREAVGRLRKAGIGNISVDLMYGFPGETLDDWQRDIDQALALDVEHISAYCLMIEEGTVLYEKMRNEKWEMRNGNEEMRNDEGEELEREGEELERRMYEMLIDRLEAAGYEHYEISNFARRPSGVSAEPSGLPANRQSGLPADRPSGLPADRPSGLPADRPSGVPADRPSPYRSRHNSSYWADVPYIGIGAAAHSYTGSDRHHDSNADDMECSDRPVRSWNTADLRAYIAAIDRGERPCEQEELDADTHYNDRITTALRTADGLDLLTLSDRHRRYCMKEARRFIDDGLLMVHDDRLRLTRRGLFVSDMVMSGLMMV